MTTPGSVCFILSFFSDAFQSPGNPQLRQPHRFELLAIISKKSQPNPTDARSLFFGPIPVFHTNLYAASDMWLAEVEGIRGRVYKAQWKKEWSSAETVAERRRIAAERKDLLLAALRAYGAMFREDPMSYYNGDNAAALSCLYVHLTGSPPPLEQDDDEGLMDPQKLLPATGWAARAALKRAPKDYWARTTLGNIALMEGRKHDAIRHYERAFSALQPDRPDTFAVDSVVQQLELFQSLDYRTHLCESAIKALKRYRKDSDKRA